MPESTEVGGMYQIRTKRVGRQRLDTKQAGMKNGSVLLGWCATVVAAMVVVVFNFLLSG
jgi:hypothetical protein